MSSVGAKQSASPSKSCWDGLRFRTAARYLPQNARILDVGCGDSRVIRHLPAGCSYVGIDNNSVLIEENKITYPDQFFRDIDASASVFPFNKEAFDAVVMASLLEYLPNPRILLSEVSRVLKLSGVAVIITPTKMGSFLGGFFSSQKSCACWTRVDVDGFIKGSGLKIVQSGYFQFGMNQILILKKDN